MNAIAFGHFHLPNLVVGCSCQTATAATGWALPTSCSSLAALSCILVLVSPWRTDKTTVVTPAGIDQK